MKDRFCANKSTDSNSQTLSIEKKKKKREICNLVLPLFPLNQTKLYLKKNKIATKFNRILRFNFTYTEERE